MVHHVIGRKHRQRYMELKRPDLATWNKQSIMTHGGKIIRARAEIIERQDGRGTPKPLGIEGKSNISRGPPRQEQNRGRNISHTPRDVPSHLPKLKDFQDEYSHPERCPPGYPNTPPFHPEDPYILNRDRPIYQEEDSLRHDRMEDELWRADYRQSDMHRREYMEPEYKEEFVEDRQRRAESESGGVPMYDSWEQAPYGQAEHYPEEAPPYRRPHPERDSLKEFYTEEVRSRQVRPAEYPPSQPVYPEGDEHRWSLERDSGRHNGVIRAGWQGSREPEAKRWSRPTPMESDRSHDHLFNTIMDYCHEMGEEDAGANPGTSRTGPPTSQRRVEVTRALSEIPEPFRRFLTGAANDEGHSKRKRKSRFSDATAEEVETTKEMFSDEYGPPNRKFGGHPRQARPEIHGPRHPDSNMESQSFHHSESYQRGGSESSRVFDMLENIEIKNAEEADFLKNKLCNLLKEFKTKKSAKAVQNSQGRAAAYNSLDPDPELSPRHQYDTTLREDSDLRRPEDLYFKEDHRGREWQQHEHFPDKQLQEYHHPVHGEPRQSNRSRYEEVFGLPGKSRNSHAPHPEEQARYPQMFQEPMHPHDYSPAPLLHMERGPRVDRGPRYSNNLDKITSTLLELVARK
ncbi:uncharacterized protein LOC115015314 isoform X2 [Cottoperca gobio]|nr:uncharacterized protein LOC115015314 isoform X2 [Cottoperca gobio]